MISVLHESTGNLTAAVLLLAVFALVILGCALSFPDRQEELNPSVWEEPRAIPVAAE